MSRYYHDDDSPRVKKGTNHHTEGLRALPFNSDVTVFHKDGSVTTEGPRTFEEIMHDKMSRTSKRGQEARQKALQKEVQLCQ